MNLNSLSTTNVILEHDKIQPLPTLLTKNLNLLHFQDSCGSGRTCKIILTSLEESFADIIKLASVTVVFAEDAFDRNNPPKTQIRRVAMSKSTMRDLDLLDEEGYVRRLSMILDSHGNVLAVLPVLGDEDLQSHIQLIVLPELRRLSADQTFS